MSRAEDCARLAEVIPEWTYVPEGEDADTGMEIVFGSAFFREFDGIPQPPIGEPDGDGVEIIEIPAPDAPLHAHLEFVGRIAEAIGATVVRMSTGPRETHRTFVAFTDEIGGHASDLSWAAIKAATAAEGAK